MENTNITLDILVALCTVFLIASALYIFAQKYKLIPFPLLLFFVGLIFSAMDVEFLKFLKLTPESVLFIYLPVLLFESAISFEIREFNKIIKPGFLLSSLGLIVSAAVLAAIVNYVFKIPFKDAFLYTSVISSTDPIAVLSIFKDLGVPKKLQLLVDGESFLNDATSVIMFRIMLTFTGIAVSGNVTGNFGLTEAFSSFTDFIYVFLGGLLLGVVMGWLFSELISYVKNSSFVEITLTIILATLVYVLGDHYFKVSGIMAVLGAGLVIGNFGKSKISPKVQENFHNMWSYLGFIVMSLVFILIGFEINFTLLQENLPKLALVTLGLLVARTISVYAILLPYNFFVNTENKISQKWMSVINVGGIRGVLPLTIILSLPEDYVYKQLFVQLVLAAIFFTLIFNTFLTKFLIKYLKLDRLTSSEVLETNLTSFFIYNGMVEHLSKLKKLNEINDVTFEKHCKALNGMINNKKEALIKTTENCKSEFYVKELGTILKKFALQIEKSVYLELFEKEVLTQNVFEKLNSNIIDQLERIYSKESQFRGTRTDIKEKIEKLKKFHGYTFKYVVKRFMGVSIEEIVKSTYLYYKAKLVGNERVLEYLARIERGNSKVINTKIISQVKKKYLELIENNKETIEFISIQFPAIASSVDDEICTHESQEYIHKLLNEFEANQVISGKVAKIMSKI